jgi:hypothetical protein
LFSQRISMKERADIFRLGERGAVLAQVGSPGIVAATLDQTDKVRFAAVRPGWAPWQGR